MIRNWPTLACILTASLAIGDSITGKVIGVHDGDTAWRGTTRHILQVGRTGEGRRFGEGKEAGALG